MQRTDPPKFWCSTCKRALKTQRSLDTHDMKHRKEKMEHEAYSKLCDYLTLKVNR